MDKTSYTVAIKAFILNERNIQADYKKETQLNRTALEILTFAQDNIVFTIYQAQKYFKATNVQTVRRAAATLIKLKLIERVGQGLGPNAFAYMITDKGRLYFREYVEKWTNIFN